MWPNLCEMRTIAGNFQRTSGHDSIIGAIDGCHIRIPKPKDNGEMITLIERGIFLYYYRVYVMTGGSF